VSYLLRQVLEESRTLAATDRPRRARRVVDDPRPRPAGAPYAYQEAAYALLAGEERVNLLVASPTGSGKTSVIVRAAQLAVARGQKLVVAEPLIALVEQVHARLAASLPGVAVDMRTGPSVKETASEASVTVCTYEVLASVCSSAPGEAAASPLSGCLQVAVDEFHYIGEDRGPVIQEILDWCRNAGASVVALSGTLVNELEVAEFISGVNGLPTVVVGASVRPVPLTFYYYDARNARKPFSALRARAPWERAGADQPNFGTIGGLRGRQDVLRLVTGLRTWDCLPALMVTFSCRRLDEWAEDAASGNDFLTRGQRAVVIGAFRDMLREIPEEDRVLFERLERLGRLGIGLHHSHLPVQYLELVSTLAEHRCLKLVFSTSTLSAGINLPVRTVCLCSGRVPRKAEGEMVHDVIDPLLFHQLAGRAGRPGYETVGNVVVIGCGWEGHTAAAALLERPLPPVRPTSVFNSGDVLRAALTGRCLALDRLVFSNSLAARAAEKAQLSKVLCHRALDILAAGSEAPRLARCAAEHSRLLANAPAGLLREPCGLPEGPVPLWLLDRGRGGFRVVAEDSDGAVPLTVAAPSSRRRRGIHSSVFEAAYKLRRARSQLAEVAANSEAEDECFWLAASVLRNACDDVALLECDQDIEDYKRVEAELKARGFLEEEGAPTHIGRAAALIRSSEKPEAFVEVLAERGDHLDRGAYGRLASLALGSGVASDEAPDLADEAVPGEELLRSRLPDAVSSPAFNKAASMWTDGASLAQIDAEAGISCGQCARHLVRTNALLCELSYARRALGLPGDPELAAASAALCRGLPFARRGGGRVALGEETE
jgi:hypothetical protein